MPRTTLSPTNLPGGSTGVGAQDFTWTAADASNGNQFASTGKEILLVRNVNAASPPVSRKVTLFHVKGKIEYTLGAGEFSSFGQIQTSGWKQTDNYVYVTGEHADIQLAVLVLP
jgi:hypothetical protein